MRLDLPIHLPSRVIRRDRLSLRNEKGRVTYEAAAGPVPFRARLPRPSATAGSSSRTPGSFGGFRFCKRSVASRRHHHCTRATLLVCSRWTTRVGSPQSEPGSETPPRCAAGYAFAQRPLPVRVYRQRGSAVGGSGRPVFFTDGRYTAQARQEVAGARVVVSRGSALLAAAQFARKSKLRRMGIEAAHMTVAAHAALCRALGGQTRLRGVGPAVEELRIVKDAGEIALIREAVNLGARPLDTALRLFDRALLKPRSRRNWSMPRGAPERKPCRLKPSWPPGRARLGRTASPPPLPFRGADSSSSTSVLYSTVIVRT